MAHRRSYDLAERVIYITDYKFHTSSVNTEDLWQAKVTHPNSVFPLPSHLFFPRFSPSPSHHVFPLPGPIY